MDKECNTLGTLLGKWCVTGQRNDIVDGINIAEIGAMGSDGARCTAPQGWEVRRSCL